MTERARRPTDEERTRVLDADGRQRTSLGATVTAPGDAVVPADPLPPPGFESFELAVTEVTPMPGRTQLEQATPAHGHPAPIPVAAAPPPGVPVAVARGAQRSEPIRVISMKDRAETARPRDDERVPLHVQLRSIAEVAGMHDSGIGLGNLAPPRDPRQAHARRVRSNVVWACVAIALACAIMLAVWLVAGK
jgi:hypothetical protein